MLLQAYRVASKFGGISGDMPRAPRRPCPTSAVRWAELGEAHHFATHYSYKVMIGYNRPGILLNVVPQGSSCEQTDRVVARAPVPAAVRDADDRRDRRQSVQIRF